MSDDQQKLRLAIDQLQAQLRAAGPIDPQVAARLETTLAELRHLLHGAQPADKTSIRHRLSEAALHFEASHPTLSGTIGSVIDALGGMGI